MQQIETLIDEKLDSKSSRKHSVIESRNHLLVAKNKEEILTEYKAQSIPTEDS